MLQLVDSVLFEVDDEWLHKGCVVVCQGGMYVLQLLDTYAASWSVFLMAITECVIIAWIYGMATCSSWVTLGVIFSLLFLVVVCSFI